MAQRFNPDAEEGLGRGGRRSRSPSPGRVPLGPSAAAAKRNQKKDMSLKVRQCGSTVRQRRSGGGNDSGSGSGGSRR